MRSNNAAGADASLCRLLCRRVRALKLRTSNHHASDVLPCKVFRGVNDS